ncbi:response regulator [candidate division WWE3 bacterium]|nr:response regulator [candidate division WWE3 bacterium]
MNKKILIIDDNEAILDAISLILRHEGFGVETDSIGSYFESTHDDLPDLVLLDISLRGRHGKAICKSIKINESTAHIPVIILSAYPDYEVEKIAEEAGADSYLIKPFGIDDLISLVTRLSHP